MDGKKWALLGFGGVLIAVLMAKTKIKTKIVDILISMDRTFGNEGGWEPETAKGQKADTGNYYKGVYYGTNYGVTAQFLVDNFQILQIPLSSFDVIKALSVKECVEIFQKTEGMRMRYDDFQNQFVADFIFDWMVHRPGTCVAFLSAKIFGIPKAAALQQGGIYSDYLIQLINSTDPAGLYNSLKYWRLWHLTNTEDYRSFRPGIYYRIMRFNDFLPSDTVVAMAKVAHKKAFGV